MTSKLKVHDLVVHTAGFADLTPSAYGVIVHIYEGIQACEVEFPTPGGAPKVVTMNLSQLERRTLPTLDEHLEHRKLERQRERERNLELAREEIERLEPHIPLHHPDGARYIAELRSSILQGFCIPKPVRCNHCHTHLWSDRPDVRCLMSHPPKEHIACPGCGWSGYL